jgi:hypothetical protein
MKPTPKPSKKGSKTPVRGGKGGTASGRTLPRDQKAEPESTAPDADRTGGTGNRGYAPGEPPTDRRIDPNAPPESDPASEDE